MGKNVVQDISLSFFSLSDFVNILRFQISVQHVLHYGVDWLVPGADTQQPHDVLVLEPLHDVRLAEEVDLLIHGAAFLQCFDGHSNLRIREKSLR